MHIDDLKLQSRWVCYKSPSDKAPMCATTGRNAASTDPKTWATYAQAKAACQRYGWHGVGIVLTGDGVVGIDIDDCIEYIDDDATVKPSASVYRSRLLHTYAEVSPSGHGLHFIGQGVVGKAFKITHDGMSFEVYGDGRYLTFTEECVDGHALELSDIQAVIDDMRTDLTPAPRTTAPTRRHDPSPPTTIPDAWVKAVWERRRQTAYDMVASAIDGERHYARWKAGRLAGGALAMVRNHGFDPMSDDSVIDMLIEAQPPSKDAERKEYRVIEDGLRDGLANPLEMPVPPPAEPPTPISVPPSPVVVDAAVPADEPTEYHLTDIGNGLRFVHATRGRLHYVAEWKSWVVWDGKRWAHGDDAAVVKLAHKVALSIYDDISKEDDDKRRKELIKWALASESAVRIDAMMKTARPYLTVPASQFDTHPHLLTVANGVVNLKDGTLSPHDSSLMLTKMVGIDYHGATPTPRWNAFLRTVMDGNDELVQYLKVAMGYTMTGSTDEHCLFFLYGVGANGKSTFLEAMRLVMGDYYVTTSVEALLATDYTGGATPYVAGLQGMRCAMASEMPEGRRFNESLVKDVTGGGMLTARHLYGAPFQFMPSHTLWISGNYRPRITGTDDGIWRRLRVIPFTVSIPPERRRPMSDIMADFVEEQSGILAWVIQGAIHWYDWGLPKVDAIDKAVMEYRGEEDIVARYIADRCVIGHGMTVVKTKLFEDWTTWLEEENEVAAEKWQQRRFTENLLRKGITLGGQGRMQYIGIGLRSDRETV